MSVPYYGDFPEDAMVYIPFNTFTSDDPSASVTISNLADTDIYYHKNGSDTDYSADAATAVSIDFDGITGNHMLAIDTSENAYFATGSEIAVRMEGTTVDGATINAWIGAFSIERAGGAIALLKAMLDVNNRVDVGSWLGQAVTLSTGNKPDVNIDEINDDTTAVFTLRDWLGKGIRLTADSGTTTTLVDAGLTQADDYWNGALLIFRTGTNIGRTAIITDFDAGTDTLTFAPAMPDAVTSEGFALIPGLGWSDVRAISSDATAADNLKAMLNGMTTGTVETDGSNSTTQVKTDLAEGTDDHYDVMTILFTSGAEAGQSRLITGYTGASGTVKWNAPLTGTPATAATFVIIAAGTTADAVWDETLTGSSHNISTSAGKRLRQIEESFVHASGTIATVTDGHTITLDAGAVATADYYVGDRLQITEGVGAGQSRLIVAYTSGKVCTLDSNFITNPNTSSLYNVDAADVHVSLSDADQAQGFVATYTNTTTITLDSAAVATANYYVGSLIIFTHGTGAGQSREITGYTSGRVVTMSPALAAVLDTTTVWHIQAAVSAPEIVAEVWDEAAADHTIAGTFGKSNADILADTNELQIDDIPGAISALNDIAAAEVNAEVVDALNVDTYGEPGQEAPGVTVSLVKKIGYLYKAWRNKKDNDGTTRNLYGDDAATVDQKSPVAEAAGTVTTDEWESGP